MQRQALIKNSRAGFTIVELLIVIVVIAILAAITLVAFNGVQRRAAEASVRSDLNNASKLVESYKVINSAYPLSLTAVNDNRGYSASAGNSAQYSSTDGSTFCLTISRGDISFNIKNSSLTPTEGACPGHGPAAAAQVVEYGSARNFPTANTTYPVNISAALQPTDVLVTIHYEHYIVGTAILKVNNVDVPSSFSRQAVTGGNYMRVTVATNLSSSDSIQFRTDGSNVDFSYYILRGINNPSAVNFVTAGWKGDGDDGVKNIGFTRTVSGTSIKAGQVAILSYTGSPSNLNEFSGSSSPSAGSWTLNDTAPPYSAATTGSGSSPSPVSVNMLITGGGGQYLCGTIVTIGE